MMMMIDLMLFRHKFTLDVCTHQQWTVDADLRFVAGLSHCLSLLCFCSLSISLSRFLALTLLNHVGLCTRFTHFQHEICAQAP